MEYYVYIYLDPRHPGKFSYDGIDSDFNYEPFYVGKGKKDRFKSHVRKSERAKGFNPFKNAIISKIEEAGFNPSNFIVMFKIKLEEQDALDIEEFLIAKIGRRSVGLGPLTNLTDGGDSDRSKGRTYEGIYGKRYSQEKKERMKARMTGDKNPMFGKINSRKGQRLYTDEQKEKSSLSRSKPILQMDHDCNVIKEWDSIRIASKYLGIGMSAISSCLFAGTNTITAGGFKWRFLDKVNPKYINRAKYVKSQKFYKIINCESGEVFYESSIRKFCLRKNISRSLMATLRGKCQNSQGYRAFFITQDDYESNIAKIAMIDEGGSSGLCGEC